VEHFQEHNVIWNGQDGRVYMFQSELAYEPYRQQDWMTGEGTLGWAAYKVSDSVRSHYLIGGGVYCYNRNNPSVVTQHAFEVPSRPNITLERIMVRNLSGPGVIQSIVNGAGNGVDASHPGPSYLSLYSNEAHSYRTQLISQSNKMLAEQYRSQNKLDGSGGSLSFTPSSSRQLSIVSITIGFAWTLLLA
jgi:hypothetical protein